MGNQIGSLNGNLHLLIKKKKNCQCDTFGFISTDANISIFLFSLCLLFLLCVLILNDQFVLSKPSSLTNIVQHFGSLRERNEVEGRGTHANRQRSFRGCSLYGVFLGTVPHCDHRHILPRGYKFQLKLTFLGGDGF